MSISPLFVLNFGHPVLPGLVTVGNFDGFTPTLVCGTTGGRAFLHSYNGIQSAHVRFLNINRDITALTHARLVRGGGSGVKKAPPGVGIGGSAWDLMDALPGGGSALAPPVVSAAPTLPSSSMPRDVLLVGTASSIQAYDVDANVDVMQRDMVDSVASLAAGPPANPGDLD